MTDQGGHRDQDIISVEVSSVGIEIKEEVLRAEKTLRKGRGQDTNLEEYLEFEDPQSFKQHKVHEEIWTAMTRRKSWETNMGRKESYACKFSQKRGYKVCKRQFMVTYPSTSFKVLVYHTPDHLEHLHEEDPSHQTKENYHWTLQQEAVVLRGIQTNTKNSRILRTLKEEGATNGSGRYPDLRQVGVKKRYMKTIKHHQHVSNESFRQH